ncbi:3-phosphoshikimate 1-carboxyvinyltransferase [Nitriliruptoraceae bacterium ZYF776]|nr:3-phosphoshikimate 1-carboxyvinyltransferase [Profundirhabdus halotolerans]
MVPLASPPSATVAVPGSKSLTNRALVAAALADGTSTLDGVLFADDTEAMLGGLRALGFDLAVDRAATRVTVVGQAGRVPPGPATVDVRLSGTTARFLAPVLALGRGDYLLDAGAPFRARPMGPTLDALRELGATVTDLGQPGHLPVRVSADGLAGGHLAVPGDVSSQFLSGLLLTAPATRDGLEITVTTPLVSVPYVELTVDVLAAFGVAVERTVAGGFRVPPSGYRATRYRVEPDASAASYLLAAAAITGGRVRVPGLGDGARQGDAGFADVLAAMGAEVTRDADGVEVRGTGRLRGIEVDLADLSDTAQTLAAVAVFAEGPTRVTGIGFIRRKETDRIAAVVTELRRCGIEAHEEDDGFVVHPGAPRPTVVATYDDHRMAMSFALLGLVAPGIEIADPGCVAKTFPTYFDVLDELRTEAPA